MISIFEVFPKIKCRLFYGQYQLNLIENAMQGSKDTHLSSKSRKVILNLAEVIFVHISQSRFSFKDPMYSKPFCKWKIHELS